MESSKKSALFLPLGEEVCAQSAIPCYSSEMCHAPDISSQAFSDAFFESNWNSFPSKESGCNSREPFATQVVAEPSKIRFDATDAAPTEPQEGFEPNTIFLQESKPADAGNRLLTFFDAEVDARITKINRKKLSLKVEACMTLAVACVMKIRIFQRESGSAALEFEKCSGDTVAFNCLFRKARQHLCSPAGLVKTAVVDEVAMSAPLPPPPVISTCSELLNIRQQGQEEEDKAYGHESSLLADIHAPLFNIVENTQDPALQAEAATALSLVVQDKNMALEFFKLPANLNICHKLIENRDFRVSCPMAKVLCTMTQHSHPDIVSCFCQGRLVVILSMVQALASTSQPLLEPLLRAFGCMVNCCAYSLRREKAQELAAALAKAMKCREIGDSLRAPYQKVLSVL